MHTEKMSTGATSPHFGDPNTIGIQNRVGLEFSAVVVGALETQTGFLKTGLRLRWGFLVRLSGGCPGFAPGSWMWLTY